DYAGNAQTNSLAVTVSTVSILVSTPAESNLTNKTTTIYGSVSIAPTAITVNGLAATISGTNWYVSNVPLGNNEDTSVNLNAEATVPNGGGGSATVSQPFSVQKPPILRLSLYTRDRDFTSTDIISYRTIVSSLSDHIVWTMDGGGFR